MFREVHIHLCSFCFLLSPLLLNFYTLSRNDLHSFVRSFRMVTLLNVTMSCAIKICISILIECLKDVIISSWYSINTDTIVDKIVFSKLVLSEWNFIPIHRFFTIINKSIKTYTFCRTFARTRFIRARRYIVATLIVTITDCDNNKLSIYFFAVNSGFRNST